MRSEERAKQKAANSANGTVGMRGSTTPIAPNNRLKTPALAHRYRMYYLNKLSITAFSTIRPRGVTRKVDCETSTMPKSVNSAMVLVDTS